MKIQKFTIRQRLPGMNDIIGKNRGNRYVGNSLKKTVDEMICWEIIGADLDRITRPCEVMIYYFEEERDGKRRDVDNVQCGAKFIMDALQKTEILPNDSPKWVRQIHSFVFEAEKDSVAVYLVEGGTMRELWDDEDGGLNDIRMGGE